MDRVAKSGILHRKLVSSAVGFLYKPCIIYRAPLNDVLIFFPDRGWRLTAKEIRMTTFSSRKKVKTFTWIFIFPVQQRSFMMIYYVIISKIDIVTGSQHTRNSIYPLRWSVSIEPRYANYVLNTRYIIWISSYTECDSVKLIIHVMCLFIYLFFNVRTRTKYQRTHANSIYIKIRVLYDGGVAVNILSVEIILLRDVLAAEMFTTWFSLTHNIIVRTARV